ncbi:MAG: glycosyl hydrolase 115 family protein [Clostridiales bacterium]|nr:glycosyl hydrolase 115 family protein [Clostridiales bacterium]
MEIRINEHSEIIWDQPSPAVSYAAGALKRDLKRVCIPSGEPGSQICLVKGPQKPECFCIHAEEGRLTVTASDELGFAYGLYEISRRFLGILPFWFWNDQEPAQQPGVRIPEGFLFQSQPFAVSFRGWFVNDEVLIHTWSLNGRKEGPWEIVFEALLRCGGNLVIPGTDRNARQYRKLASDMGLWITHHHAEPLGAEMFARAFPELSPSYAEHGSLFRELWRKGIRDQSGLKVIWNIGFRGQGDCPFWVNDPAYATEESRGELISSLIRLQYRMVKEEEPEAVCCTNLYGETMELYKKGLLDLPEDVIKIWADNGYGKMVTRRQENHNPRIPALPDEDAGGSQGIYYHVSFYDLQAANHITMFPNSPEFMAEELGQVLERGMKEYWIINCSNVKPHVYFLDLISEIWKEGKADIEAHRKEYVHTYYGTEGSGEILARLKDYPKYALAYGRHEDEHAGEQFSNHVARILASQFMRDRSRRAEELLWAVDAERLEDQIRWYKELCRKGAENYSEYLNRCEASDAVLTGRTRVLFRDSIFLQAQIHYFCFTGALRLSEGLEQAAEGHFKQAFYLTGLAKKAYERANCALREREHGKWKGFYANECLTDIKQTAWVLEGLMSFLRNLGDGPHFYQWQREFLYSEEDRRVMLIMNMENHLKDQELFEQMETVMGEDSCF